MPEATPAAPAAAASPTKAPEPVTQAETLSPATQPATETKTPEAKPADAEVERRAAALARASRIEAKAFREQQALKADREAWRLEQAETLRKAKGFDELNRLSAEDPAKYLEAAGLKLDEVNKRFLEKTTGAGKSAVQLAREAAREEIDAREKLRAEEDKKKAATDQAQRDRQTEAWVAKELQTLLKADPDRFEYALSAGAEESAAKAWRLVQDFWIENKQKLDFSKALDAIEYKEEQRQLKLLQGKKLKTLLEKQELARLEAEKAAKADAAKATKPQSLSSGSKTRGAEQRPADAASQPTTEPSRSPLKRPKPFDPRKAAKELWDAHKAASDN